MAGACGLGDKVAHVRWAAAVLCLALGACGPVGYANEVARRAATAVDDARAVDAPKHSPYWWTRATQYLEKARETGARADFQASNLYGKLAAEAAEKAAAESRAKTGEP